MNQSRHPIISGVISVLFVIVVQVFATPDPVYRFLLPAFVIYLAAVGTYNFFYLRHIHSVNIWVALRPLLLIAGWFGVYFIIPNEFWRGVYLLAGVPVIYFIERMLGNPGEQLLFNETTLAAFTGYMTIVAFSHYYLLPGTIYLLAAFVFTVLLTRSSYELTPQSLRAKWLVAIVMGLAITEVFWAASFMPLHYSATALLVFDIFYTAWTLCYYFLYNHLTSKKIQFHIVLAVLFAFIILAVTPWSIIA